MVGMLSLGLDFVELLSEGLPGLLIVVWVSDTGSTEAWDLDITPDSDSSSELRSLLLIYPWPSTEVTTGGSGSRYLEVLASLREACSCAKTDPIA